MLSLEALLQKWENAEHRFLALDAEADRRAEIASETERLHRSAQLVTVRREYRESKGQVVAVLAELADHELEGGDDAS